MTKKTLNQNSKYIQELIGNIEKGLIFSNNPMNRFGSIKKNQITNDDVEDKVQQLLDLKKQINSIQNCNIKENSKRLIMGDGEVNSPIMLIGETPAKEDEQSGRSFKGEVGELLDKMLLAIDIKREKFIQLIP